jgi:hypothetical protein
MLRHAAPCCAMLCHAVPCCCAGADIDLGLVGMSDMEIAKRMQDDDLGADPDALVNTLRYV